MPTGTGKTLIANLVALLWGEHRPQSKTLIIVPRRTLALQHNRYAAWARELLDVLVVTDAEATNPARLGLRADRAGMLIGLPGLMATCIANLAIPATVTRSIDLIIIDEFDEFLHQEYNRDRISVRFDRAFEELRKVLGTKTPTVLMSGTSPNAAKNAEAQRLSLFVNRKFRAHGVPIAESKYARFIPKVRLRIKALLDPEVVLLDEAVGTELMFALNNLGDALKAYVDTDWLFPRLPQLLARRIKVLKLYGGRQIEMTQGAMEACKAIQAAMNRSLFLQEDMLAGYEATKEEFPFFPWDDDEPRNLERGRFCRRPEEKEYHPFPRAKFAEVLNLAASRNQRPGVVFVRHIRLAEALVDAAKRMQLWPAILHGGLSVREQDAAIQALGSIANLLVMVRETGKRGLDLPQADYAIFFSARSSETGSWQEFSRIRSTVSNTKDVYLLAYAGTREINRLSNLLHEIRNSDRQYEIVEE